MMHRFHTSVWIFVLYFYKVQLQGEQKSMCCSADDNVYNQRESGKNQKWIMS